MGRNFGMFLLFLPLALFVLNVVFGLRGNMLTPASRIIKFAAKTAARRQFSRTILLFGGCQGTDSNGQDKVGTRKYRNDCPCMQNENGATALLEAVRKNQVSVVKLLLDVNYANMNGRTPLMMASENGCFEMVELLLTRNDIDKDAVDESGDTALMEAVRGNHVAIAKLLIDKNADVNKANKLGITPLMIACEKGYCMMVELLLTKENIDKGAKDKFGDTALIKAAEANRVATAKLLIDRKADVNAAGKNGITPLIVACEKGYIDIVELLLTREDVNKDAADEVEDNTALMWAIANDHWNTFQLLLDNQVNLNRVNRYGRTPLMIACQRGRYKMAELLLTKPDLDKEAFKKGNPIHRILRSAEIDRTDPHVKIIQLLLDHDAADVNSQNEDGDTCLHLACNGIQLEAAVYLFKHCGADFTIKNKMGRVPLDCCVCAPHDAIWGAIGRVRNKVK